MRDDPKKMGPGGFFVLPEEVVEFILKTNTFELLFLPFLNSENKENQHIYTVAHEKIITHLIHKLEIH